MGSSLNLNLSLKPSHAPKTLVSLLKDLSKIDSVSGRLSVLDYYLLKYEEELARVEAFKRELPQCMLLLMEAIETLKEEIMNIKNLGEPETEKSMKRKHSENDQMILSDDHSRKGKNLMIDLNSPPDPQPWNPTHDHKKQKTVLHTCQAEIQPGIQSSTILSIETTPENQRGNEVVEIPGPVKTLTEQIWKNNRRTWTPELHARFVEALNILGGERVDTPKEIRDVMQVEGLTSDQVKSHLQKYRLHVKIPGAQDDVTNYHRESGDPSTYYQP